MLFLILTIHSFISLPHVKTYLDITPLICFTLCNRSFRTFIKGITTPSVKRQGPIGIHCDAPKSVPDPFPSIMASGKTSKLPLPLTLEVFVNNTNLTFLAFLYKISIEVSLKNKVASNTDHHWITSLMLIQLS